MACGVHAREIEESTITSVLNECLRDFPHMGALRKEQKTCLVNLVRRKIFLQSCRPASVLPDNKVAITEQSQEGVIFALQSTGPRGDVFVVRTSKPVENLWKNGLFWIAYSFVTHSVDRKPRDWRLARSAYSIKYGKGGRKFGADFRIPETQMELNEIAWFY